MKDVDRYQAVLANLLLEEDNKFCADCQSKGSTSHLAGEGSSLRAARGRRPVWGGGGLWSLGGPDHLNGNACYRC